MAYINFNGKILAGGSLLAGADSRALKFGDGLFETMRYRNGEIVLWERHMHRFFKGLEQLKFAPHTYFTPQDIREQVESLLQKNGHTDARVRLTAFRGDGGLFDPTSANPSYLIQTWALDAGFGAFNENGLQLCIYRDAKKSCDFLSNIKHNNYLLPVMASFFAKEQKCNDAIIVNQYDRVSETTNTNIFIIKDNSIITPALTEGCVAGTQRSLLLELLPQLGCKIAEGEITIESLLDADEIFITNALRPIRWVAACGDHVFGNQVIKMLVQEMGSKYSRYFI